jgi:excisionase family DNA binding protein
MNPTPDRTEPAEAAERPSLPPQTALRILCQRTGGTISATTFYRWVRCGKIASIRLGSRIFIPRPAIEAFIDQCFAVD